MSLAVSVRSLRERSSLGFSFVCVFVFNLLHLFIWEVVAGAVARVGRSEEEEESVLSSSCGSQRQSSG